MVLTKGQLTARSSVLGGHAVRAKAVGQKLVVASRAHLTDLVFHGFAGLVESSLLDLLGGCHIIIDREVGMVVLFSCLLRLSLFLGRFALLGWGLLLLGSSPLDGKVTFDFGCNIILLVSNLLPQELSLGVLVELMERVGLLHSLGVGCYLFQGTKSLVIV